jgi:hypothetical protein
MLYRDLTFASFTSLKHAVMVYRERSTQTLYVSTPFLPGATAPTFTQALLGQIICADKEALQRDANNGPADGGDSNSDSCCGRGRGGPRGGGSRGGAPPRAGKRKGNDPESGPSKKPHVNAPSDHDKIPVATLSTMKQLAFAKVSLRIVWLSISQVNGTLTVNGDRRRIPMYS